MPHGIPAHFEVTEEVVKYLALGKLADLGNEIADARKLSSAETKALIKEATMIRLWIQALDYGEFITKERRDKIKYALVDIASVNDFGTVPILNEATRPAILIGGTTTVVNNDTGGGGETFSNVDVDTGTEDVDSFAYTLADGAVWHYVITDGTNYRAGIITCTWNGTDVVGSETSSGELGDTSDVTLDVIIDTGNVKLQATAASDNWSVTGTRYFING